MTEADRTDVVMFSGGIGSWAAAKLRRASHPDRRMVLLFADVRFEDEDLYRFLPEAAANVGAPLVVSADGRDIWQVFVDEKYLGNTRVDPCSRVLKREHLRRWLEANHDPGRTTVVLGFGPEEGSRVAEALPHWAPWDVAFPLHEVGMGEAEVRAWLDREGIDLPRLYDYGFSHNNCRGGCVKAGIGTFVHLLRSLPDAYAAWEAGECRVREALGKDVAILRDRRGRTTTPLPLADLRRRVEAGEQFPSANRFACGCFAPPAGGEAGKEVTGE